MKSTSSARSTKPQPTIPVYVPSVRDRLGAIKRQLEAAGVYLGIHQTEMGSCKVEASDIHLSAEEVNTIIMVLTDAWSSCMWLHNVPDDLLDHPAPSDSQRAALTAAGGAR